MNHFYISSVNGCGGISAYSRTFYDAVLCKKGYFFIDSSAEIPEILRKVSSKDHVHIEIGLFTHKETEILIRMLGANYRNVSITLHDPPLLKYPLHAFRNPVLNIMSKFYDRYLNGTRHLKQYYERIKNIYVLSETGAEKLAAKYKLSNVRYLPHIVVNDLNCFNDEVTKNLIHFGFIGRNKGLDYALLMHKELLNMYPDVQFYVVGKAMGRENRYLRDLQKKYFTNVHYLGFVDEERMDEVFNKAGFAIQAFKHYKFYWPISGSILNCMKKGKIVFTNKVNTVAEVIEDKTNGVFLTGDIHKDVKSIADLFNDNERICKIRDGISDCLLKKHSPSVVEKHLLN